MFGLKESDIMILCDVESGICDGLRRRVQYEIGSYSDCEEGFNVVIFR